MRAGRKLGVAWAFSFLVFITAYRRCEPELADRRRRVGDPAEDLHAVHVLAADSAGCRRPDQGLIHDQSCLSLEDTGACSIHRNVPPARTTRPTPVPGKWLGSSNARRSATSDSSPRRAVAAPGESQQ